MLNKLVPATLIGCRKMPGTINRSKSLWRANHCRSGGHKVLTVSSGPTKPLCSIVMPSSEPSPVELKCRSRLLHANSRPMRGIRIAAPQTSSWQVAVSRNGRMRFGRAASHVPIHSHDTNTEPLPLRSRPRQRASTSSRRLMGFSLKSTWRRASQPLVGASAGTSIKRPASESMRCFQRCEQSARLRN